MFAYLNINLTYWYTYSENSIHGTITMKNVRVINQNLTTSNVFSRPFGNHLLTVSTVEHIKCMSKSKEYVCLVTGTWISKGKLYSAQLCVSNSELCVPSTLNTKCKFSALIGARIMGAGIFSYAAQLIQPLCLEPDIWCCSLNVKMKETQRAFVIANIC